MDITEIAKKIEDNGGRLYLVGGAVRDKLLNIKSHDEDYCVTGISSSNFKKLFPTAYIRGKAFEVFELEGKEFAMARTEIKNGVTHKDFKIETGEKITIIQDLARRDITINAIAQDVLTREIIDPYNGRKDIKNKIIRATTKNFAEDALRVYRVARFASILEFQVDDETIKLMKQLKNELKFISKERVFEEFKKALSAKKPSIFFEILKNADVLEVHFKEIYDLIGALQPDKYHPEGDSFNHTMLAVDKAAQLTENLEIRFSSLVHDLGKGITPVEEYPHHYGHEINGVELVENFGKNLKVPISWMKSGKVACREHMRGGIFYKMKPAKKVEFIERICKSNLGLHGLQIVVFADKLSSGNTDEDSINFEKIGKECLEQINGKYIKEKYNIIDGLKFKERLHEERVKWMISKTE